MSIRVFLAEDHDVVREGLRSLLEKEQDLQVVGEAQNGKDAVRLAGELRPDVVVMDVSMPLLNGIDATRQVTGDTPGIRVVALSTDSSARTVIEMFKAGAVGYVSKNSAYDELARAIRAAAKGHRYVTPEVADTVVPLLVQPMSGERSAFSVLSPRQREIVQLLAEGKNTKEIAWLLDISPSTAADHRKNVMAKLEIASIAELTRYAIREGLVSLDG